MAASCETTGAVHLDDEAVRQFIESNKAKNTVKKTRSDLNVWNRWCESVNERRKLEDIPASELNRLLSNFFVSVRKQNGENYEPSSLTDFQRSIDRHLKYMDKEDSILNDKQYEGSRQAIEAKRKELRRKGKGRRQNAAQPLTEGEENSLWSIGELGSDSPLVLLHTIWYLCTMHFGWRGIDEHKRVCFGDFQLGRDDQGVEYVEFCVERGTKTRNGCEGQQERAFNPRMYAVGGYRCPVALFNKYVSVRPAHTKLAHSPFYLQPANTITQHIWYKNQPVGANSLSKFMKVMTENAGIEGKRTNHSARKTMITKLVQNDTNPLHVAQLTGHKNIKSLDSYSIASKIQQKKMLHLISSTSSPLENVANTCPAFHSTHAHSSSQGTTLLPDMQIYGNNIVNVHFHQISSQSQSQSSVTCEPLPKKRKEMVSIDSEEEQ